MKHSVLRKLLIGLMENTRRYPVVGLYCFLILVVFFCPAHCVPKKRKTFTPSLNIEETIADHERKHFQDYNNQPGMYENWPEINKENLGESCEAYLSMTFQRKDISTTESSFRDARLIYKQAVELRENNIGNIIRALQCTLAKKIKSRLNIHFTRAPSSECVYLISRKSAKTWNQFYISAEMCKNIKPFIYYAISKRTNQVFGKAQRQRREEDTPGEQLKLERDHYEACMQNKDIYTRWPELREMVRDNSNCQKLLGRLLPKTNISDAYSSWGTLFLDYVRMKERSSLVAGPAPVATLRCHIQKRPIFHFIRATKPRCLYYVKQVNSNRKYSRISKQFCEEEEEEEKEEEDDDGKKTSEDVSNETIPEDEIDDLVLSFLE